MSKYVNDKTIFVIISSILAGQYDINDFAKGLMIF